MTVISTNKDAENLTLTVVAEFDATPELVWEVWEDPRKLERWWGPPTFPATFTRHDFVVGGESRYLMTGPAGETPRGWWRIDAIDRPRRLDFANGLAGVCMSWGLTVTKVAQRRAAVVCGAIGLALFFLGANTVLFFATGTRFYLRSDVSGLAPHGVDEAAPGGPTPVIAVPGANPGAPTAAKPGGPAPSGH